MKEKSYPVEMISISIPESYFVIMASSILERDSVEIGALTFLIIPGIFILIMSILALLSDFARYTAWAFGLLFKK